MFIQVKIFSAVVFCGAHSKPPSVCAFKWLSKATVRCCFPGLTLLAGSGTVPASPVRRHCPTALLAGGTSDASYPTTGKATQLTFTGRSKSLPDFATWDVVTRPLQLASLCEQEQCSNCSPLRWCHFQLLQLLAKWKWSTCDFQTRPQNSLGSALSYMSWLLIPGLYVMALYVAFSFPSYFRSLTSFP